MQGLQHKEEYLLRGELDVFCSCIKFKFPKSAKNLLKHWIGKDLEILIKRFYEKRSNNQNNYLHGVLCKHLQTFHKEVYGELKSYEEIKLYIYKNVLNYKIEEVTVFNDTLFKFTGKRFSKMKTVEFIENVEIVLNHFNPILEFNNFPLIPLPDKSFKKSSEEYYDYEQ